jgi:replicative DNA helicase
MVGEVAQEVADSLPMNADAERTILGAVLLDNRSYDAIAEKLDPVDFALDSHNRIFECMGEMINGEKAVDIVTLCNELHKRKVIESVGGWAYVASLTEGLPMNPVVDQYVEIVRDKSLLRRLMLISNNAMARAADESEPAGDIVADVEQQIVQIAERGLAQPLETFGVYIGRKYPTIDGIFKTSAREQGLPTGFKELDELTCGLQRKDLIIVAARPSMGKTALGLDFTLHASCLLGKVSALFSLEMTKEAMLQRAMAIQGSIALQDIREGRWTENNRRYAMDALGALTDAPLYIDDEPGMTVQRIKAKALRLKNQLGRLDLCVIDQLNHIAIPDDTRRQNRTDQVGVITRALKVVAKILDCPMVVLHQLNRENEKREDKEPKLSDLRDSGNIEQDADVVFFPHRPGYYSKDPEERADRKAVIIIAKQRQGPTGRAHCEFIPDQAHYRDLPDSTQFKMF